jgi:N-acyl-D-amino-acid deacylase
MRCLAVLLLVPLSAAGFARADDVPTPTAEAIRGSIERGLVRVEAAARNYPNHRDCFTCHHQTLPAMAMVAADRAGIETDRDLLAEIVAFSADSFETRFEQLEQGTGIGGSSMTVGYGLWAFWEGSRPRDELSDAMVGFLLKNQESSGRWKSNSGRPPLEGSHLMCSTLAAYGIKQFAPRPYRALANRAEQRAKDWLLQAEPADAEDRAAKLWGLWLLDADPEAVDAARSAILAAQRGDGGWSQLDTSESTSDAYATGQALALLARTGTSTTDPAYRRGLAFLITTQCDDGSWFVRTRARPFQTMFDNGDPHGESSFISVSATCWAVTALSEAVAAEKARPAQATVEAEPLEHASVTTTP